MFTLLLTSHAVAEAEVETARMKSLATTAPAPLTKSVTTGIIPNDGRR